MAEQPAHKRHDLQTSADLERVTDYAEETEIQADIAALNLVEGRHLKEKADQALREKELARVVIKKDDVDLISTLDSQQQSIMAVKLFFFLFGISLVFFTQAVHLKDAIPDEKWDYVNVRENAHMFWWLYGADDRMHRTNLPLVLWLQGGPGGSSTGFGNFDELGPLDVNLKPRNTSWTQIANVLFVDNPVGAGFSYVTNKDAYTKDVKGIAEDLFTMLKSFMKEMPIFQNTPFFIFCESYGGKMTSAFGVRLHEAISAGEIKCNFRETHGFHQWILS
ncbi:hypothetical protein QZH41_019509 [Actinostola sp. cb2023]|nr:hypothetical protein QZH41_019509 [Actinostola sp. cb2023]